MSHRLLKTGEFMRIRSLFLLFTLFNSLAFGAIEDHLKIAQYKSNHPHHMRNIDFIYMINLDERPEKYKSCIDQLDPFEIFPYRFSAVNGWKLSLEAINDVGVKFQPWMQSNHLGTSYLDKSFEPHHDIVHEVGKTYFCHCMARGTIGCVLSHLSVLKDAYDAGYQTIWIMEDDIQICQNPHLVSDLIEKLDQLVGKDGWDILFTDPDTKNSNGDYVICLSYAWRPNFSPPNPNRFATRRVVSSDFKQIGARYGTYSMIVRRSGIKKILDFIMQHGVFLPYDMDFYLPGDMRLFTVIHDVVSTQPRAFSDNGSPAYEQSINNQNK